jgi:DNA-binding Lrp family transcriptional regulator
MHEAKKLAPLDKLDSAILRAVEKHGKLGLSAFAELTGAKKDTLKVRLAKLMKTGRLERNEKGPATFYIMA